MHTLARLKAIRRQAGADLTECDRHTVASQETARFFEREKENQDIDAAEVIERRVNDGLTRDSAGASPNPSPFMLTPASARSRTKDFGVFTNQRFALTDRDNFDVGLRYSEITVNALTVGTKNTYEATTGNASYNHQFTKDLMAYVSHGTSFRPGSGNSRAAP